MNSCEWQQFLITWCLTDNVRLLISTLHQVVVYSFAVIKNCCQKRRENSMTVVLRIHDELSKNIHENPMNGRKS